MGSNKLLITGGAGYIGSHMVHYLKQLGWDPWVIDNLSQGHAWAIEARRLYTIDLAEREAVEAVFREHDFEAVMHFAGSISVGESVNRPDFYYRNNMVNTLTLLETMVKYNVKRFIFSSSAAVYGTPETCPIEIDHPVQPNNPYGETKAMVEAVLKDFQKAYELNCVSLRYFNAAGADYRAGLGEWHEPETHLIPLVLQTALGLREQLNIYGEDYPTRDGTCVRDFIHVIDLCQAHALALDWLIDSAHSFVFNLGTGSGYTVKEVWETAQKVTGRAIPAEMSGRREGDAAQLVADSSLAERFLGWSLQHSDLERIIHDAWQWELQIR